MSRRTSGDVLDEVLVVQCQLGDAASFTCLVDRWNDRLLRHAYRLTGDADAARDVAQEAWIGVVRGIRSLDDPARFRAWVFRIVAHKARDWLRRETSKRSRASRSAGSHAASRVAASDALGAEDEDVARLRDGLRQLEAGQRAVLTWFYLDGLSVRDLADALSIPAGTVKSRLYHARAALRRVLENAQAKHEEDP